MNPNHPQLPVTRPYGEPAETADMKGTPPAPQRGPPAPQGGLLLGRYRIISELGRGGMGVAYRCHDTVAGVDVAVKVLRPEYATQREHLEAVRANFALIERLHHPHIAALKTLDRDEKTGQYLVVMEYVEGLSLDRHLKEQGDKLPLAQVLPLVRQVSSALDFGHREKIIHRDIKPSNVMVDLRGQVKLLDFGIAERFHDVPGDPALGDTLISGTAAYMAPEQWRGQYQDARTDQYALAVMTFRMLAGQPPFTGPRTADVKQAALTQELEFPAAIPAPLHPALTKGLARNRMERFASCEAFVSALEEAGRTATTGSPAHRLQPARLRMAAGLAVLGAVAVGLALTRHARRPAPASPDAAGSAPPAAMATSAAHALPAYSALVIGISDYSDHGADGWDDLDTARADAQSVAETLSRGYGFKVRTLLDGEATRTRIMDELDDLSTGAENSAVMIYYAGHGTYEKSLGEGYWIPSDARRTRAGKPSREDWIWNSTITKIVGASAARHVLIVADACYGGALFRGGDPIAGRRQLQWYRRAMDASSRYLITSGDMEPVLDSGGTHSVFCGHLLNYLNNPARAVFSASDLGTALRERVSSLTDQMVRMGQLPVSSHAGGEFVFVKDPAAWGAAAAVTKPPPTDAPTAAPEPAPARDTRNWSTTAQDAVWLAQQGATNAARKLAVQAGDSSTERRLLDVLLRQSNSEQDRKAALLVDQLIERVGSRKGQAPSLDNRYARPRILVCYGPESSAGGMEGESVSLLYRLLLRGELETQPALCVVERAALDKVMLEMNLGTGHLSDRSSQLELGKLLPASLILLGDVLRSDQGDRLFLRLVDAETTRVLGSFSASVTNEAGQADTCRKLASEIAARASESRPLTAAVLTVQGDRLTAGIGRFQGARLGQHFDILRRQPDAASIRDREVAIGQAEVADLDVLSGELKATWSVPGTAPASTTNLWVREHVTTAAP